MIFSGAFLMGIPAVLDPLHGTQRHFNLVWPTDWMWIPLIGVLAGVFLLVVPVKKAPPTQAPAATPGVKVTGEVVVDELSESDAAGVRAREVKNGTVEGKANVGKASGNSRITGADAGTVG